VPSVLLVSPAAGTGGSEQALARLVPLLVQDGWRCHVVVPEEPALRGEMERAGGDVHVVPMRRITTTEGPSWWARYAGEWPLAVSRLVRLARRLDVDLVASNSLHTWYGWATAAAIRRPHLWHAREIVVQSPAALGLERRLVARFADLLVSCSHAVDAQFADVVPASRRVVVHEDVDRAVWSPQRHGRFRSDHGIDPDVRLVGFVGRIDTWKGLDVLLSAWPAVLDAVPHARLVVAGGAVPGKERYEQRLREVVATLPAVDWMGHIDSVPDLMADLDVLTLPSTEPEPYGLVVVEALASGARVVVTDDGGAPEIVARAEPGAGVLARPGRPDLLAEAVAGVLAVPQPSRRAPRIGPLDDADLVTSYRRLLPGAAGG
jgi:glycosyltransferase involved in cell wall biosynthesis